MDKLDITYYGINDLGTGWQLKSLIEDYIGNSKFEQWFESIGKSPIENINQYKDNLKVKVILQLSELVEHLYSEDYKQKLYSFRCKTEVYLTIRDVDIKLIKYINSNVGDIVEDDDYMVMAETLKFIIDVKGIKCWDVITNNDKCVYYLGFNSFDKAQKILNRIDKALQEKFIRRILIPLKIHANIEQQLDILKSIKLKYKDIAEEYESIVMDYLKSADFIEIDIYQRQTIVKKIIDSKCFNKRNEILLNYILIEINDEASKVLSNSGRMITYTSDKFMSEIQKLNKFREKIFLLLYEQDISLLNLMMVESKEFSIIDIVNYNGISKNKYKNSTLMKISHIKKQIQINTLALIKSYSDEFWNELSSLINDVVETTQISNFLQKDIIDVRFLIDNKKYFIAVTFLSQGIERLLRELYLRLEYDLVGVLKNSNFTLKNLLEQDEEQNPLIKLFKMKELESLNFFLNDRGNGENIRNNMAHYLIDSDEINEIDAIFSLDILMFILLKIDYQRIIFKEN